ncbi:hypothetical protein CP533_2096 [Ophiocordyceps camponoti-saundersi (nom. inval.)]|nr:hypothetical protein CP533_2096 [Ophiocordyceps camponoti-saundersi (nom. inval.)]
MGSLRKKNDSKHHPQIDDLLDEKRRYPGAENWAPDEERLFTILYFRQERTLLPLHWNMDFRDIPIFPTIFAQTTTDRPVIYAHSHKEFQATTALIRLIDLTRTVRAACQTGNQRKAPAHIKKALDLYVSWAAEDGGYHHLDYVPNLLVDVVDDGNDEDHITQHIEGRMRALARLQRRYFRLDRHSEFWNLDQQRAKHPSFSSPALLLEKYMPLGDGKGSKTAKRSRRSSTHREGGGKKRRVSVDPQQAAKIKSEPTDDAPEESAAHDDENVANEAGDNDARPETGQLFHSPPSPAEATYSRRPPVVYGLFILRTSVLLLTVDSSKEEAAAPVSFHVDMHFIDPHQSVWNAITVAIAVCLARDELRARAGDFDPAAVVEESDPDL